MKQHLATSDLSLSLSMHVHVHVQRQARQASLSSKLYENQTITPIANAEFLCALSPRNANANAMQQNTLTRSLAGSIHYFSRALYFPSLIAHAAKVQAPIVLETGTFSAGTARHRHHQARRHAHLYSPVAQALASAP